MRKKKKRFQVRFHLGKGANYMCWQVKDYGLNPASNNGRPDTDYYAPSNVSLELTKCVLKNSPTTAQRIYDGQHKTVCAWVQCDEVQITKNDKIKPCENDFYVRFNPRHNPNWTDRYSNIMNDEKFDILVTDDRSIFVLTGNHECDDE